MSQDRAATTFPQSASSQEHKCCILCGNKGTQLPNYSNWGAIEKEFLHTHLDRYPPEGSYICKKHWIEAQRHHTNSHYIPKWKEVHTQEPQKCCIHPQCCNKFHEKLIKPAFANITELEELLEVQSSTDNPFLLCLTCYTKLYRQFNPVLNCTSCRAMPKHGQNFVVIVQIQQLYPSTSKIQLALMWSYHQMTGYVLIVTTHTVLSLSQ